ncbi:MAG: DUF3616 domain-containing protein [Mangrovicoccus sp.]
MVQEAKALTEIPLHFKAPDALEHTDEGIHLDLSAAALFGDQLFVSCDETAGVDRLTRLAQPDRYDDHRHFTLAQIFDLPGGEGGEMDIEGLHGDCGSDGDWLWAVGSHSLKRGNTEGMAQPAKALKKLGKISFDQNRQFLGRVPLAQTADGLIPVAADGPRKAAALKFTKRGKLREYLAKDPLLAPYLAIPSKDNGFDIEGVAARGLRVWLGLRGPVLRGNALVLELEMELKKKGRQLKPKKIDGKLRYRKHFLPLGGEGIRDMVLDGEDLLLLVGTPLAGDGRSAIMRWRGAVGCTNSGVRPISEIELACALPYRGRTDNPEGLALLQHNQALLIHDSPDAARLSPDQPAIIGDIWQLAD